eukprot:UN32035
MMREYVEVAESLQAIRLEVLSRLIELIRTFNSRTCHLVLGAGAMTQVGLNSITARHLSVSFSCIALLECCLPRIIKSFQTEKLDASNRKKILKSTLEKTLTDLREHQKDINQKLIGIMHSLIDDQCNQLQKSSWCLPNAVIDPNKPIDLKPDKAISTLIP